MGYFGNATVFAQEPDWEGLGGLPFAIRAYRHRRKPVWVVGISDHRSFDDPDETFHVYVPTRWATEAANRRRQAPEVIAALDRLAAVRRTLEPLWDVCLELEEYLGLLAFAAEMARRAGVPAYFFAANDEMLDIGCLAAPDRFERFAFACSPFLVDYRDGAIHLAPYERTTDDPEVAELLGRCTVADGVRLRRFTKADGLTRGRLYGIVAALWPKEMAPAKTVLKIGSGNPFDYVERDLQVIAERLTDEAGPLEVRPLDRTPARPRGLRPERVDLEGVMN